MIVIYTTSKVCLITQHYGEGPGAKARKPGLILILKLSLHPWLNSLFEVHFLQLGNEENNEQHTQLRLVMTTG